jgi:hypothetical protein
MHSYNVDSILNKLGYSYNICDFNFKVQNPALLLAYETQRRRWMIVRVQMSSTMI